MVYRVSPVACSVLGGLTGGSRPNKQASDNDQRVKVLPGISFFFHLVPNVSGGTFSVNVRF
jgi:hypothetical protein